MPIVVSGPTGMLVTNCSGRGVAIDGVGDCRLLLSSRSRAARPVTDVVAGVAGIEKSSVLVPMLIRPVCPFGQPVQFADDLTGELRALVGGRPLDPFRAEFREHATPADPLPRAVTSVDWYRGWRDHLDFALVGEVRA